MIKFLASLFDKIWINSVNLFSGNDLCVIALLERERNEIDKVAYVQYLSASFTIGMIDTCYSSMWAKHYDNHQQALEELTSYDSLHSLDYDWAIVSLGRYSDEEIKTFLVNKDYFLKDPRFKVWEGITIKEKTQNGTS